MTRQELLDKYGHIKLKFTSYYKYSFTFQSDDGKLVAYAGGDKDDIYRFGVDVDKSYLLQDLPLSAVYLDKDKIYDEGW